MIFAVDAGNTNIVLGGFDNDKLLFLSRIATQTALTADEYAVKFSEILRLNGHSPDDIEGAIISSVVTPLTPAFGYALKKLTDSKVVTVGPGIKTGVNIKIDDPAALGADLVCGAVGAMEKYDPPCVIFDLGTATTISAISRDRIFLGGSIIPGVKVSHCGLYEIRQYYRHSEYDGRNGCSVQRSCRARRCGHCNRRYRACYCAVLP